MATITVFELLIYAAVSLIFLAIAMERKGSLFGVFATLTSLWELGQLASVGITNVVLTTAYDSATTSFHDYTIDGLGFVVLLSLIVIVSASS